MKKIILITLSFPYYNAGENTFLQNEIEHLCRRFDSVTILPANTEGEKQLLNCEPLIDYSLSVFLKNNETSKFQELKTILSPIFWNEIIINPNVLFSIRKIRKILGYIKNSVSIYNWFSNYLIINNLKNEKFIAYTYWCTYVTNGIGLCKEDSKYKLITRAHGLDLYEERGSVVCRSQLLKLIDGFYLISKNGLEYLNNKYPQHRRIFHFQPLGIKASNFKNSVVLTDKFIIVSCSSIDLNKRISLIFDSIKLVAEKHQQIKIYWHHFGDGIFKNELEKRINSGKSNNLFCILHGFVNNEDLISFYENNSVNLFINTSISEGIPVSMMEALSFGIPLIGTNVGGVSEIIDKDVGILLSENPIASEIANRISYLITNRLVLSDMKSNALRHWKEKFNADVNYTSFVNHLYNNYL